MIYKYEALDRKGDTVSDYIDATSESAARSRIRSQGLYPVKLKKEEVSADDAVKGEEKGFSHFLDHLSREISIRFSGKQVGLFSRQLSTLLKAGMPLPLAITDIIEQIENKHFRSIVADLKEKLEEGSSFSNALQRHKNIFSEMYVNMVRVGENLGSLDHVMERLAEMEEKKNLLKSKIQSALYYPMFMLIFAGMVVIFLLVSVIPSIAEMFADQERNLPLPTKIVMGLSDFLSTFWFLIPLVLLALYFLFQKYSATPEGRKKVDELKLNIPIFKRIYRKLIVLRFTQNLGVLMSNRVDIMKSFEIVQKIVGNAVIEEKISEAAVKIREGSSVSKALSQSDFLPRMVIGMMSAGEASDNLDTMMLNIGNVYETEIDLTVTSLTSLIEPLIIVIMGLSIGLIVISVMLPIMEMNLLVQ